jgi:hypothetical protein
VIELKKNTREISPEAKAAPQLGLIKIFLECARAAAFAQNNSH